MNYQNTIDFARDLDRQDPLHHFRDQFYIPPVDGKDSIYLCGNSLGLQPKTARAAAEQEFWDWQNLGVEGHFQGTKRKKRG
jgi:kynureninase